MSERYRPPPESEPEGSGWLKAWVPRPGTTFLVEGAFTRSLVSVEPPPPRGLVGVDLGGRWNHGGADTLSLIVGPDTAREWGAALLEAADAAERDQARVEQT